MPEHDLGYYVKCMIGGAMACGLTHAGITPVDLVKCRKQIYPSEYKSIAQGIAKVRAEEGLKGLSLGFGPTLVGYSMQGLGKFGFYELFKDICQKVVGDETFVRNRKVCWALSSACAEVYHFHFRSLPMFYCALSKPSKSEFKPLKLEHSLLISELLLTKLNSKKV